MATEDSKTNTKSHHITYEVIIISFGKLLHKTIWHHSTESWFRNKYLSLFALPKVQQRLQLHQPLIYFGCLPFHSEQVVYNWLAWACRLRAAVHSFFLWTYIVLVCQTKTMSLKWLASVECVEVQTQVIIIIVNAAYYSFKWVYRMKKKQ